VHSNNVVIGIMDMDGKRLASRKVECDLKEVVRLLVLARGKAGPSDKFFRSSEFSVWILDFRRHLFKKKTFADHIQNPEIRHHCLP